jgi:hypothetical protein
MSNAFCRCCRIDDVLGEKPVPAGGPLCILRPHRAYLIRAKDREEFKDWRHDAAQRLGRVANTIPSTELNWAGKWHWVAIGQRALWEPTLLL